MLRRDAVAAGALHEPDARSIDVAALLQAYVRGATRRGALLLTGAPATGASVIDHRRGGWHVVVGDTAIEADVVVNAGGAWGDEVAKLAGVAPLGLTPLPGMSNAAALVLFFLVLPVFAFPLQPLFALLSRRHEFEADAFAAAYEQFTERKRKDEGAVALWRNLCVRREEHGRRAVRPDPGVRGPLPASWSRHRQLRG